MAISLNNSRKLLVDKKTSQARLRKAISVSPNTIKKMKKTRKLN